MKVRIGHKLFLAMLVTTGLGVALVLLAQRYTFERGLLNYAQEAELGRLKVLIEVLERRYAEENGWAFIAGNEQWPPELIRLGRANRRQMPEDVVLLRGMGGKPTDPLPRDNKGQRGETPRPGPPLWARLSLLDTNYQWVAGAIVADEGNQHALYADGSIVGYLNLAPLEILSDELDLQFARQQLREVFWVAIVVLFGVAVAAALLARSLGSPIRALARGTHVLAGGRYETRLEIAREDELGQLAEDFNSLAAALERSRQARQQWVADISHELRTPIAVLQAELESLEDGLRPLNVGAVQSLSTEVKRLRLLVDDLHQLTQSDSGTLTLERVTVDLASLLDETIDSLKVRLSARGLTVDFTSQTIPSLFADPDRLRQLFGNLLENALRYTDSGGTIRVATKTLDERVRITIEDSDPGVTDESLPHLFDRLFRVDPSRSREKGASGLGLAICKSIVEAHGGTIRARHSELGGLAVDVELPTQPEME